MDIGVLLSPLFASALLTALLPAQRGDDLPRVAPHVAKVQQLSIVYLERSPILQARFVQSTLGRAIAKGGFRMHYHAAKKALPLAALQSAHVVLVGDLRAAEFKAEPRLVPALLGVVERGGALIFGARLRDDLPAPLAALCPVRFGGERKAKLEGHRPKLTRRGLVAPFLRLEAELDANEKLWRERLDAMRSLGLPAHAKKGSRVFVTAKPHGASGGSEDLLCVRTHGNGRCFFVGFHETWRWRRSFGARYFDRFWTQLVRYAALALNQPPGDVVGITGSA